MTISKCKEHGAWSKEKDREIGKQGEKGLIPKPKVSMKSKPLKTQF